MGWHGRGRQVWLCQALGPLCTQITCGYRYLLPDCAEIKAWIQNKQWGTSLGGGQGGLCSFPACNNEAVISVSPGGGLAGETVKRGLSSTVITRGSH